MEEDPHSSLTFMERMLLKKEREIRKEEDDLRKKMEKKRMIPMRCIEMEPHSFFKLPYNPPARAFHSITKVGDKKYIMFGGADGGKKKFRDIHVFNYDKEKPTWDLVQYPKGTRVIPKGRNSHSSVYRKGCLYIYGGIMDFMKVSNELYCYHIGQHRWEKMKTTGNHPPPLYQQVAVHYENTERLQKLNKTIERLQTKIEKANLEKEEKNLSEIADEKEAQQLLADLQSRTYMDVMIMYGGDAGTQMKNPVEEVFRLDFTKQPPHWTIDKTTLKESEDIVKRTNEKMFHMKQRDSPGNRTEHSGVLFNQYLVIYGGQDENQAMLQDCWRYDIETKEWEELPQTKIGNKKPGALTQHSACIADDNMFIYGGGVPYSNEMFRFDLNNFKWSAIDIHGLVPRPRFGQCSILVYFHDMRGFRVPHARGLDLLDPSMDVRNFGLNLGIVVFGGFSFESELLPLNDTLHFEVASRDNKKLFADGHDENRAFNKGAWKKDEVERFNAAVEKYGKDDLKAVTAQVGTRNHSQVRNFFRVQWVETTSRKKPKVKTTLPEGKTRGNWTDMEKFLFVKGIQECGRDYQKIAERYVTTRTMEQIRNYAFVRWGNV